MIGVPTPSDGCRRVCNNCGAAILQETNECSACGTWFGPTGPCIEATAAVDHSSVYHTDWWRRLGTLLGVGALGVASLCLMVGHRPKSLGDFLFSTLFVLLVLEGGSLLIFVAQRTYLVLTRQGIEYHSPGGSLYTPWDNVVRGSSGGLRLRREPAFRGNEWCRPVAAPQPGGTGPVAYAAPSSYGAGDGSHVVFTPQSEIVCARTYVPLDAFAWDWKQSDLGREIAYHAPQVFGQVPASMLEAASPEQEIAPPPSWPTVTRSGSLRTRLWGYIAIHVALLLVLAQLWTVATS